MAKKRKDGRYTKTFVFQGKRYFIYGTTAKELKEKELLKRQELMESAEDRYNPSLNNYYKHFTDMRRDKIKDSTLRSQDIQYRKCANLTLDKTGKTLGEYRIKDITPKDMQVLQLKMKEVCRTTETANNCIDHLSHVFHCAVKDETISRNPCECLEHIKRTEKPARETKHRALSTEETKKFFELAEERNSYYYNCFAMMIQTGLRVGELTALMETDIDEKKGVIHVRRTISRNEVGGYYISDSTKTRSGIRDIPLNESIMKVIRAQKRQNKLWFGNKVIPALFSSSEGMILREYTLNREIKRICDKAGIEKFTCHAFRSTFATRFIEQRPQDYKVLAEILGHSKTDITLNLYTHVMQETKIKAMNEIRIAL